MGSMLECKIEGFICRLCSQIDRNVIHIYTDEGIQKKLEQKINVYLKINLSRYDPLPKVICLPCDAKLEQHHRFIQRVIQNQKKIQGNRPIIPLLEQHLRVRVREDESNSNTYNIEALSSSDSSMTTSSDSSTSDDSSDEDNTNSLSESHEQSENTHSIPTTSSSTIRIANDDEEPGLAGFNSELEPVNLENTTENNDEYRNYDI
ncbi:hypothetical protein ACKWTF_012673 [Chironomus riparius]